jgi:hypothetical protein
MRDLPRSVYSTPGMIGMHDAGIVPETDAEFGGLQRVYAARTAAIAKARAPCFGHVTVKNRGDVPYRGAFLVVAMLHVPDKPDIIALHGCWVLDKEDLPRYTTTSRASCASIAHRRRPGRRSSSRSRRRPSSSPRPCAPSAASASRPPSA